MQKITNKFKTVLVSGASGDIGIGIGRILKSEGFRSVIGCDINIDSWGVCIFDSMHTVPRADKDDYLQVLKEIIGKNRVDLFIPSSEAEIQKLFDCNGVVSEIVGCEVLLANDKVIEVAMDKKCTAQFLAENTLDYPWTITSENGPPDILPCIFKPRRGQGSKGIEVVTSRERAVELSSLTGYVFQELLLPDDQEYTCGVFRSSEGIVRSIVFNRILQGGFTGKGIVVNDDRIDAYIKLIAETLELNGAINLQLRLTDRGPVLFEINPRFSSTVVFRHKMGFSDLIWAIENLANEKISNYVPPIVGTLFYRGISEYIISEENRG